ncbi:hypothetical protein Hanom_Chr02g00129141 [Helianthus anomalus]
MTICANNYHALSLSLSLKSLCELSATTEPSKSATHHRLHLDPQHHHTASIQIHRTTPPPPSKSPHNTSASI